MVAQAGRTLRVNAGGQSGWRLSTLTLVTSLTATVLLAAAIAYIVSSSSVVASGQLVPGTDADVYDLSVLGGRLYVEPEVIPTVDVVVAGALLAIGSMAFLMWLTLSMTENGPANERLLYAVLAAGGVYLAVDELIGVHESIGHNLGYLFQPSTVVSPSLMVAGAYGVAGAAFLVWARRVLGSQGEGTRLWRAALWVYVAALVLGYFGVNAELLSLVVAWLLFAGFLAVAVESLSWALVPSHRGRVAAALDGRGATGP